MGKIISFVGACMHRLVKLIQSLALASIGGCAASTTDLGMPKYSLTIFSDGNAIYGPVSVYNSSFEETLRIPAQPCATEKPSTVEVMLSFSHADETTIYYSCSTFQACGSIDTISMGEMSATSLNRSGMATFKCGALDVEVVLATRSNGFA